MQFIYISAGFSVPCFTCFVKNREQIKQKYIPLNNNKIGVGGSGWALGWMKGAGVGVGARVDEGGGGGG